MGNSEWNPLISVIIPVYNAESYLSRCIESVCNQTYRNLEIILVDDGSCDGSPAICNTYAAKDERIRVIRKENGGVSSARNQALEIYKGDYLTFVDADDWIAHDMIKDFVDSAIRFQAQIVSSVAVNWGTDGKIMDFQQEIPDKIEEIVIQDEYSFLEPYAIAVVWGKLFKRECIEGISFSEDLSLAEDSLFLAETLKKALKMVFMNKRYYNYVYYAESLSHGKVTEGKFMELEAWQRIIALYKKGDTMYESACIAYVKRCKWMILKLYSSHIDDKHYYDKCKEGIIKYLGVFLCGDVPLKEKLTSCFAAFSPMLYLKLKKLHDKNGIVPSYL